LQSLFATPAIISAAISALFDFHAAISPCQLSPLFTLLFHFAFAISATPYIDIFFRHFIIDY